MPFGVHFGLVLGADLEPFWSRIIGGGFQGRLGVFFLVTVVGRLLGSILGSFWGRIWRARAGVVLVNMNVATKQNLFIMQVTTSKSRSDVHID